MTPFYITCYNSPALLRRLLGQLDDLIYSGEYQFIISDQSDDKNAEIYKGIVDRRGFEYIRHVNRGATAAKKAVLAHALSCDYELVHQISEDFIRTDDCTVYGPVSSGKSSFDTDALTILKNNPELAFCKWNVITCHNGDMQYLYSQPGGTRVFNLHPQVRLPYLTKDIGFTNWPATWRPKKLELIRQKSLTWTAPNEREAQFQKDSGGEWAMNMSSLGKGACLVAQPFFHPDRTKPPTSLP